MSDKVLLSVVIATYNSAKVLPATLRALKDQTYPKRNMEILVVDGDSFDGTRGIAKSFGCKVLSNPDRDPVSAKFIGFVKARGKYAMYLDHDEVLVNRRSIEEKVNCLENEQTLAVAGGGYVNPKGYPFINEYINEFGDPFSFFMYRLSKKDGFYFRTMRRRFGIIAEKKHYAVFDLSGVSNLPLLEVVAGGSMFDAGYLKKNFPKTLKSKFLVPHYFYLLNRECSSVAVMRNDPLIHYSAESLGKYLKKISWRVRNNIHFRSHLGESGYSGREKYTGQKYIKFLFIPYSFSLIFPLMDALYLVATRKKILYLIHLPLCLYTASLIGYHEILRLLGVKFSLKEYGA